MFHVVVVAAVADVPHGVRTRDVFVEQHADHVVGRDADVRVDDRAHVAFLQGIGTRVTDDVGNEEDVLVRRVVPGINRLEDVDVLGFARRNVVLR